MQNIYKSGQHIAALALLGLVIAPAALAQSDTLTTLTRFGGTNGNLPTGPLVLSGSTLYGTAQAGGAGGKGTVFSLNLVP